MALLSTLGLAALAVAGVWGLGVRRSDSHNLAIERLVRAAGRYRPLAARLTGGMRYAPCRVRHRANEPLIEGLVCLGASPPLEELERLAADLRDVPTGDHARALFHLLWPRLEGSVERAVEALRRASQTFPQRADIYSDLSAALLARAEIAQDPQALIEAHRVAERAIELDSSLAEAWFNRALALEWLHLPRDALEAWSAYLAVDPRSEWASEARLRSGRLIARLNRAADADGTLELAVKSGTPVALLDAVAGSPWRASVLAEEALFSWARNYLAGSLSPADSAIALARDLSRALELVSGDSLLSETAARIQHALDRGDRSSAELTARGLVALQEGLQKRRELELAEATRLLERAEEYLTLADSPMRYWAKYGSVRVWTDRHDPAGYRRALALAREIRRNAPRSYHLVRGYAARSEGLIHHRTARYEEAMEAYQRAIAEGSRTGDPELSVRVRSWLAELESALRGPEAAWNDLYAALKLAPRFAGQPFSRSYVFELAARASRPWNPALAFRFQSEAIGAALQSGDPRLAGDVLVTRARLAAELGDTARARADLEEAFRQAAAIPNDTVKALLAADIDLARGLAQLRHDPENAISSLARAVGAYRRNRYRLGLAQAYLYLASAYAASNRIDSAEAMFELAMAETEGQRSGLTSYQDRIHFLDYARPVFDRIASFYIDRGNPERAWEFLERARARVLLEQIGTRSGSIAEPAGITAVRRHLAPEEALISYASFDQEVVIWVIEPDRAKSVRVPIGRTELQRLVLELERTAPSPARAGEALELSTRLYRVLVQPAAHLLPPAKRLLFVPDGDIHRVPFAALREPDRGRYLVEDYQIAVLPSGAFLVAARSRTSGKQARPTGVLAVGNPLFDRQTYRLPYLPAAEREARQVAAAFPRSALLIGKEATEEKFIEEARKFDIVHFAGHAVVKPEAPSLSHLLFAPGPGDGALYARELADLNFEGVQLAVLSGCHTAAGRVSSTEGPSSLARAFFAAGVPAVIASLWAVEDESTSRFFDAYHQKVAAGENPLAALRETQLEWIAPGTPARGLSTWAAFQFFGVNP
ncbi:hypothetical protein HRbin33_00598 [bacterium HR33]|nr:hypothetical protein HRbin33_00598 [bacterium HR33]